jgi:glutathione-specific gamma-glutamylcyclotransferase
MGMSDVPSSDRLEFPGNDGDEYGGAEDAVPPLSPEIAALLAQARPIWIFAYGSLMWNPGFAHDAVEPVLLRGWHRSFCIYSRRYRGTPERPGLVLGLDRGGACRGMAIRIPAAGAAGAVAYLWEREMAGGVYDLRRVRPQGASAPPDAFAFTVRRSHSGYAGRLSIDETARLILQGIGGRGRCREYLANTVRQLECLGHLDGPLHALEERVKELAAQQPPCP